MNINAHVCTTRIDAAPATERKAPAQSVLEVPFDMGEEFFTKSDGELSVRPATHGLIHLNLQTLLAADGKIEAIQNRMADLEQRGIQEKDANGEFHYADPKTGETVTVAKQGDVTIFEQGFLIHEPHRDNKHVERFEQRGPEVEVSMEDAFDTCKTFLGISIPFVRPSHCQVNQSFKYTHDSEGLKTFYNNEWHLAKPES